MIFLYGFGSIIFGMVLANVTAKFRDKKVSKRVSEKEIVELQMNQTTEESLRIKYSPSWLNLLALMSAPLILGGFGIIIYNLWQIEIFWVKIAIIYGILGVIYAFIHIKNIDVGASGPAATFLTVSTLWPFVLVLYVSKYFRNKKTR